MCFKLEGSGWAPPLAARVRFLSSAAPLGFGVAYPLIHWETTTNMEAEGELGSTGSALS